MANQYPNDVDSGGKTSIEDLKDRASEAKDRAADAIDQFGTTASAKLDNSPLIAVAGGIAIGALLAAVLPQTERENELLQPVGSKLTTAGRDAVAKVRETGRAKVDELAGDKVREFFGVGGTSTTEA